MAYRVGGWLVSLTVGLVLLAAAAMVGRSAGSWPARPPVLSEAELSTLATRATVILTSGTCQGSAFFVTPELLLTNAHVVCAQTAEAQVDGRTVPATILEIDDELDVALLRAEGAGGTPLRLADAMRVRAGDRVVAAGAPGGRRVSLAPGVVTLPLVRIWGVLHIESHASLAHGNSGGPLLDDRGRAVGVISKRRAAGGRPVALALPVNYLASWLPAEVAVDGDGWREQVAEAVRGADADLVHFQAALRGPMLVGAHFMRRGPRDGGGPSGERALVFVLAAPAAAVVDPALTAVTVRLTCGDTRPRLSPLSAWAPVDRPIERSSMIDVTQLRPFLSWARKRSLADRLVLATGVAPIADPPACPAGQLALLEAGTVSSTSTIE